MNTVRNHSGFPRVVAFVALAAVLGLTTVTLSQCRLVDDSVTGVDIKANGGFSSGHSECVHKCNDKFKRCESQEEARHRAVGRACDAIGDKDARRAAQKAEDLLHKKKHLECVGEMQVCKKNCDYREGAGGGGR